jgi:Macrophage killing protein with similarity to conjugation protein.
MEQQNSVWPSAESAVAAILLGDLYANARLHFISRILTGAMISVAILLIGVYALIDRPAQFRYILTDTTGVVVKQVPLPEPNQNDQFVIDWAVDAVTRLYTFDYDNYRIQFQDAKRNLTITGWENFEKSMEASGNFNAVKGYQYVTTAAPTGPGRITKTGAITIGNETRFAWKVEFPMVISYRSSRIGKDGKPLLSEQNLTMSATVIRVPEYINQTGLGIRALVAE